MLLQIQPKSLEKACRWYNLCAINMEAPIETKLDTILAHFDELDQKLAEAGTDYQLAAELSKERAELEAVVSLAREYKTQKPSVMKPQSCLIPPKANYVN